jgi:hypothetical protein
MQQLPPSRHECFSVELEVLAELSVLVSAAQGLLSAGFAVLWFLPA